MKQPIKVYKVTIRNGDTFVFRDIELYEKYDHALKRCEQLNNHYQDVGSPVTAFFDVVDVNRSPLPYTSCQYI